jgi:lysophospholipase L1-like esterase
MIRPIKIFLYFLLISLLVVLFDQWLERVNFSIPTYISELQESQLPDTTSVLLIADAEKIEADSTGVPIQDSLPVKDTIPEIRKRVIVSDSVLTAPPLFQELFLSFCQKARSADSLSQVVRVLHMGDSQIEADRITSVLRTHFQQLYGGSGPGFVMPIDPLRINANVSLSNSGNWTLSYSYKTEDSPSPVRYGFPGKAAWFSDTTGAITITPIAWNSQKLRRYPNVRLMLSSGTAPIHIETEIDDQLHSDTITGSLRKLHLLRYQATHYPKKITFRLTAPVSPVIHGVTLDHTGGVAVDNLAMRGRPWPGIRIADNRMLQEMSEQLNVGFIILQYGTNVLPTKTDNYNFYRIHFLRELKLLRRLLPGVPILVIGVQSAAESEEGELAPMEHAELISEAQKSATLACGMAFFDLHKVMGGTQGAIEWANESPSLMLSDHMHFSGRGARIVGDQIWMALDSLQSHLKNPLIHE